MIKCHVCPQCDGFGCISELPGMGGIRENENFQLNCQGWDLLADYLSIPYSGFIPTELPKIRLAPITGGVENVGYPDEEQFYFDLIHAVHEAGAGLSIGDGCPDIKIQSGIRAVQGEQRKNPGLQSAVFIKPYSNEKILQRIEWSRSIASSVGVDIDSYNIVTMRNLVQLEKKTAKQLLLIKEQLSVPFAIKGVFTPEDVELVKEVKPDIVLISNHGGRVDNLKGSTAAFLAEYGSVLRENCTELWVDGGIRKTRDLAVAAHFGVSQVLIGRPFITALCSGGTEKVKQFINDLYTLQIPSPMVK